MISRGDSSAEPIVKNTVRGAISGSGTITSVSVTSATGWLAGQAARDFTATDDKMLNSFDIEQSEEFKTTKYFCKTHFDMKKIKMEEDHYVVLPKIYEFKNDREKEIMLNRNFKRVNQEVEDMVKELLGMS